MQMDGTLDELIEQLIERMQQEDYISIDQPAMIRAAVERRRAGRRAQPQAKFEITDKSLDFLGFKTLRDLLGSLGKIELRTPRHARHGHRNRGERRRRSHTNSATR